MTQEKKNVKEIEHTIGVRIDCSRLLQIVELKCSIDFEETWKAKNRNRTELDLKNIQRSQREKIDEKSRRVQIIHGEFVMIIDEETYGSERHESISKIIRVLTLFEITRSKLNRDIKKIERIGNVIDHHPDLGIVALQRIKGLTGDGKPEIVQNEDVQENQPIEEKGFIGGDDEVIARTKDTSNESITRFNRFLFVEIRTKIAFRRI